MLAVLGVLEELRADFFEFARCHDTSRHRRIVASVAGVAGVAAILFVFAAPKENSAFDGEWGKHAIVFFLRLERAFHFGFCGLQDFPCRGLAHPGGVAAVGLGGGGSSGVASNASSFGRDARGGCVRPVGGRVKCYGFGQ